MNRPRFLLPEAEHLQLHPEDFRHPRNRPTRYRQAARRLAIGAGLLLLIVVLIVCLATWHDYLAKVLPSAPVWETRDWPVAP